MLSHFASWLGALINHGQILVTDGLITAMLMAVQTERGKPFSWEFTRRLACLKYLRRFSHGETSIAQKQTFRRH
jgi:hypothetical protein